ncbi:hypothetical protein CK203_049458 [Vitis vinifera]|uniref:Reverse transcriptase/retrotransposon-derived protein RNase H-like domain-containing protein n=1 Tax=Vitis vinifera TaxID=29760 RepID=A0A438HAX3_VITVI|nr:hypothetical protein CK203_049458 [Vitis vinifera]
MLRMEILTTQVGGIIQISHGSQEHLSTNTAQPSQQASSLEQAIVNLSKVVGDFVGDQKAINAQLSQRIDSVENTLNKRMDGMQNDLSQKIDNLQYSISRLTNLNTVQEKGRFPSQPHQNPKVSMKWKLMKENLHSHDWRKGSEKALLDLGASVNLLPYSVYKQLGLGELKPTSITLSLADRSVKIPRGIIEDVLVQVDNFYYPVDFVVLDTDPLNGLMQLTFGNMTLELNIFYMSKKLITPEEEEGPEEVCIIDTLVEEHCNQNMQDKLNESLGDLEEGLPEPSDVLATLQGWRRREEILPLFNKEEAQEAAKEETPKLNLKPLPMELKYIPGKNNNALHSPLVCTHHIYMEEEAKPIRQPQRRLNPHLQEVVRAEVLKLLQAGEDHFHMSIWNICLQKNAFWFMQCTCNIPKMYAKYFSDMVERIMEVFMDDITIYGGIVLGHIISEKGIEVDKAKVELIVKLPSPTTVKGMSKSFDQLKQFLTTTPIVRAPNWQLPFEVMCDASDFAIGAVLGQREDGKPYVIYYASKTLNEAQRNYTTTEKELLVCLP